MNTNQLPSPVPVQGPPFPGISKPPETLRSVVLALCGEQILDGVFDALDWKILNTLVAGPLATPKLAFEVHENPSRVRSRGKRLESKFQLLSSHLEGGRQSCFFFPVTREVVTRASYPRIKAEIAKMKAANPDDPDACLLPLFTKVRVWELVAAVQPCLGSPSAVVAGASETVH